MKTATAIASSIFAFSFVCASFALQPSPPVEWTRQFGTPYYDTGNSVTTDGVGGIYITGPANGSVGGAPYAGNDDIILRKYDSAGGTQWTRQLGTSGNDTPESISSDGSGNLYVAGTTGGNLAVGATGSLDPFLLKYNTSGTLQWSRQFGTSFTERGRDVFADIQGNIFVSGITEGSLGGTSAGGGDAFVSKFNAAGTLLWSRQYGTSNYDFGNGVATDAAGNVYVTGETDIYSGFQIVDSDAFLIKYDAAGNMLWTRQIHQGADLGANDLVVKGNDIFIVGSVLFGHDWSSFIARYNTSGDGQSYFEWGTSGISDPGDLAYDVAADSQGGVVVVGTTEGALGGSSAGSKDATVSKFDASGNLLWIKQFGSGSYDEANGIATDSLGNIYAAGGTTGVLGGTNSGYFDMYLAKLNVVPEPSLTGLMAVGLLLITALRAPIGRSS